jgi:hypothetical protein
MKTYIFFQLDSHYPVPLYDDDDAIASALRNPGTMRVEDDNGRVVWRRE